MDYNLVSRIVVTILIFVLVAIQGFKSEEFKLINIDGMEIIVVRGTEKEMSINSLGAIDAKADIKRAFPNKSFSCSNHHFIVRYEGNIVLLGAGSSPDEIKEVLRKVGIEPIMVDRIFLTHIHKDQLGGLCENGKPVFENAQVIISSRETEWLTGHLTKEFYYNLAEYNKESIADAKKMMDIYGTRVIAVLSNGEPLLNNVYSMDTYGHTPGHMAYRFELEHNTVVFTGDIFFSSEQIQYPSIFLAEGDNVDQNIQTACNTRQDFVDYLGTSNIIFCSSAMEFPGVGILDGRHNFKKW